MCQGAIRWPMVGVRPRVYVWAGNLLTLKELSLLALTVR